MFNFDTTRRINVTLKLKMNWDEDIDLLAGRKHVPKQGRRAGLTNTPESTENLLDNAMDLIDDGASPEIPLRTKRTGGWADEPTKSSKSKGGTNILELERFQEQNSPDGDDDDDIPVIPDIDEVQDELVPLHDVKAANVTINKATYKELDSDLTKQPRQSSFDKTDDVDLSFLLKHLCSEQDVKEPKEAWTMESLFEELIIRNAAS